VGAGRLLLAVALLAAGCGQEASSAPPAGPAAVRILVSRDFGATVLKDVTAAPGVSAMKALRRSADVGTAYEGRFVTSIDGLAGSKSQQHDWLYFVNGIDPGVGAADMNLHPGDQEWWDYRLWRDFMGIPAVIGAWPEPFVHGLDGEKPAVTVEGPGCAVQVRSAREHDGARIGGGARYRVRVSTFAQEDQLLADWQTNGFTVRVVGDAVQAYGPNGDWHDVPGAAAVIVARSPDGIPGKSFELLAAGRDQDAACAAARTLADAPQQIEHTYAAALDAQGRVVAAGGQP
jgi:hypothetical protein